MMVLYGALSIPALLYANTCILALPIDKVLHFWAVRGGNDVQKRMYWILLSFVVSTTVALIYDTILLKQVLGGM